MGGSVKKLVAPVGRIAGDVATGGLAEFARKDPWTGLVTNPNSGALNLIPGGNPLSKVFGGPSSPSVSGPFTLDQAQFSGDQNAINSLGEKQYNETINQTPQIVSDQLKQILPNIAEDYNAGHVLNSTAYPQEVARQASQLTQNLVLPAIQARQGFQTGALQRGLSLEDFVNQANVSKSIGAAFTPQQPNGKQNFGTVAQGIGALAPLASVFHPAAGMAATAATQKGK